MDRVIGRMREFKNVLFLRVYHFFLVQDSFYSIQLGVQKISYNSPNVKVTTFYWNMGFFSKKKKKLRKCLSPFIKYHNLKMIYFPFLKCFLVQPLNLIAFKCMQYTCQVSIIVSISTFRKNDDIINITDCHFSW